MQIFSDVYFPLKANNYEFCCYTGKYRQKHPLILVCFTHWMITNEVIKTDLHDWFNGKPF